MADGVAHQALGPEDADGLDAHAGVAADFFLAAFEQVVIQKINQPGGVRAAFLELDAGVHIFGILTEDNDIDLLRVLHRAGHALVVLDRAHAGVEVEKLAERHVEGADAAADGRGERSLDGDPQVARRGHRVVRQPGCELAEGLFAGEDFKPANRTLAAVGLFDRCVENALRSLPDVAARAVALDEGNDGIVGHFELPVLVVDGLAVFG